MLPPSWKLRPCTSTMTRLFLITIFIGVLSLSFADVVDDETLTVRTSTATYRGKRYNVDPYQLPDYHGSVAAYTRIPYAEPPVGDLRFRRPVPKTVEGDFDATREFVSCSQITSPMLDMNMDQSEDCLTLDVFVPEPKPSSAAVMFWIHGGAFTVGTGSFAAALPTPLVAMNDVIVVALNYRLGVFGFLGTGDDDSPFNLGLLDQRQALLWVQENIAAFGGDPSRVTLFGVSAGGMSVSYHVLSPMSAGLFSGAIMQSGTAHAKWSFKSAEVASSAAYRFGAVMNCSATTSGELSTCLRGKTSDEILNYFNENPMAAFEFPLVPTIDGKFVPKNPLEITAAGEANQVATMVGCMREEGGIIFLANVFEGATERPKWDRTLLDGTIGMNLGSMDPLVLDTTAFVFTPPEEISRPEPDYAGAASDFAGDWTFLCPVFSLSADLAEAGTPVYTYVMTHAPSRTVWAGTNVTWLGASHGEDIPYVLGNPFTHDSEVAEGEPVVGLFTEEEVEMSLQVMKYWSNFAKTGNPNLSSNDAQAESKYPAWPKYSQEDQLYKDISLSFPNQSGSPDPTKCQYLQKVVPKLLQNTAELARLKALLEEKVSGDSEKTCDDPTSCP